MSRQPFNFSLQTQLFAICLLLISKMSFASNSAVILQYHHVDEHTPPSTSISPQQFEIHLNWLKDNEFSILPLDKIVDTLKNKKSFSSSKVAAITFDDANISVCTTAWPILKKYQIPFTLFVSTEAIERQYTSQCSWTMLQEIARSGLVTIGNHTHSHRNLVTFELQKNKEQWQKLMMYEIDHAANLIEHHLGTETKLLAYPYGEYNLALTELASNLGYISFGQQSGPVGYNSDFSALPRFSASGLQANLETLQVKLLTLPFPAEFTPLSDNPIALQSVNNPPEIKIELSDDVVNSVACFNALGERLVIVTEHRQLLVSAKQPLELNRHRYTCTSLSPFDGRYYWYSHQWIIEP